LRIELPLRREARIPLAHVAPASTSGRETDRAVSGRPIIKSRDDFYSLDALAGGPASVQCLEIVGGTPATARRKDCRSSRANRCDPVYLRAAQAYMLISMPTGTSTILGAFQVIPSSRVWRELHAEAESRTTSDMAQVQKIEPRTPARQV
jgi:hypothetical protein